MRLLQLLPLTAGEVVVKWWCGNCLVKYVSFVCRCELHQAIKSMSTFATDSKNLKIFCQEHRIINS